LLGVLGALGLLAGCSGDDRPAVEVDYGSRSAAPERADYPRGGDTSPYPAEAIARADLEDGSRVVAWIDPRDIRLVRAQFSDPDDPSRWTEPTTVVRAGDGCLDLELDAEGPTVAIGASCYAVDVFAQQAPDQSFAAVTTDRVDWQVREIDRESDPQPDVLDGGERVRWTNGALGDDVVVEWSRDDGF
jgi:hypothetical protein